MNILDNELVKKYFGCKQPCPDGEWTLHPGTCRAVESERVLCAMQEPIRKGERYLGLSQFNHGGIEDEEWAEEIATRDYNVNYSHFGLLRLPDKFQKKEPEWWPCKSSVSHEGSRCMDERCKPVPKRECDKFEPYCQSFLEQSVYCLHCGRTKSEHQPQRDEFKCPHGMSYCAQCQTDGKWQITGKEFERDEVEEKIKELIFQRETEEHWDSTIYWRRDILEKKLRELVELVERRAASQLARRGK